jgi:outer membrane protease
MRSIITLLLVFFSVFNSFCQNDFTINLLEKPSNELSDNDHYYLFELKNNSKTDYKNLTISKANVLCKENGNNKFFKKNSFSKKSKSNLDISVKNQDKHSDINALDSKAETTTTFFVKLSKKNNAELNTANCFEIFITNNVGNEILSNTVIIESLIPDPNDFN